MIKKILFASLLLLTLATSSYGARRRSTLEWGLRAGVDMPRYSTPGSSFEVRNRVGWHVGIDIMYRFSDFAIGPQLLYENQSFRIRHATLGTKRVETHSVDVPVIFSVRAFSPLRIEFGPVVTLMNNCRYAEGNANMPFGVIRPLLSYTVGLGVEMGRHVFVDLRYFGQFRSRTCYYPTSQRYTYKMSRHSLSLSLGLAF